MKAAAQDADHRPLAIVIGAGLGGLSAAMRLGARGYKVSLYDKLDRLGGRGSSISKGKYRFDLGPTILTVPEVFEKLWSDCGRSFPQDVKTIALDPCYEIRWPDGSRFQVRQNHQDMLSEVRHHFPQDFRGYQAFLKDSEARYHFGFEGLGRRPMNKLMDLIRELPGFIRLRADRSVYAHAAARVKDPKLRMALSFHPLFIGGDPLHVTSMYILVNHLEKAFGVHAVEGGVQALADAMGRVIIEQGGDFHLNCEVEEILLAQTHGQKPSVKGVRLSSGEVARADVVVSNADPGWTYDHLLSNLPKKRWHKQKLQNARWSMGLFVWYFGTRNTRKKWPDIGQHTILNGPRYKGLLRDIFKHRHLAKDMSIYLHRPACHDPTAAPDGGDSFYALAPVPNFQAKEPVDWQALQTQYKSSLAEVLEQHLIPGFQEHLEEELIFTPKTFQERYRSPFGAGFSLEPRIFQSAWFRPHNVSEDVENLFLVGAGTHPGAGIPSVVTSSEVMAQLVPDATKFVKT